MYARLSKELSEESKTALDNLFITDFLPFAPENCLKVYILGLALARGGSGEGDIAEEIARRLNIEISAVNDAFSYWAGCGVVNLVSGSPATVEFLPISRATLAIRKFSKTKYKDFNDQLHAMFPGRNVLPAEYNEYYSFMETMHMEPAAMLAVIAYSIRLKGEEVTYPYILAVARNLARQGCLTYDRVNEQLSEFDLYDKDLLAVIKALGLRRSPSIDDKRLFKKWTTTFGFPLETVIKVAGTVKKGGIERLDARLTKYYESRLVSFDEIEQYEKNRERLFALTKEINRIMGLYYEQLDFIIETYVLKWQGYGFDDDTLLKIADYCFRSGVRTLRGLDETVDKFYRQGLISAENIDEFMFAAVRRDEDIREVLDRAGVSRPVTSRDRDAYRTWSYTWKMPKDLILLAAEKAAGNASPVAYMNAILGNWHNDGVDTAEKARSYRAPAPSSPSDKPKVERTYTSEQLNAMFDNLSYEDI